VPEPHGQGEATLYWFKFNLLYFRLLPPEKRDALMVLLHNPDDG